MNTTFYYKDFPTTYTYPELESLFGAQAQLDTNNIPENMLDLVQESQQMFLEQSNIYVKYSFYDIKEITENKIIFSTQKNKDYSLNGTLLPLILKDCQSIMLYILTVSNYDNIQQSCEDDIMLSFFADAWGSAYVESADNYFLKSIREDNEKKQIYMTNSHNPGQHKFPLNNQNVFFDLLQPEDLKVKLTKSCLMMPSKSISGVVGLSDIPQDISKVSCDFCNLRSTCPTAYIQTKTPECK